MEPQEPKNKEEKKMIQSQPSTQDMKIGQNQIKIQENFVRPIPENIKQIYYSLDVVEKQPPINEI